MRVLVIHPHLYYFGGSERLTRILIYELAKEDNEIIVLTKKRDERWFPDHPNIEFEYIKELNLDVTPLHVSKLFDLLYSFNEVILKYEPEVVLSMIQEPVYASLIKSIKQDLGVAMYIHFPYEEEVTSENLQIFLNDYRFPGLYENLYKFVDLHIVNSNFTARQFYYLYKLEANVVYPAIEWDFYKDEPDLEEKRENVIVYIGRFVPRKRQDVLIEKFLRRIKPEVPDARLILIGVPDKRHTHYYEMLKSMEKDDIQIIDKPLSNEEMIKILREAKVYVHMRIGEHFGMAPVEAMSQGVIPIVPEQSGIAEFIKNDFNGYVFRDDEEMVKHLLRVLKMDEEEIKKIRENAYKTSWYFNPSRFAREIYYYLKVLI